MNKIKYGLKNVHYAKATIAADGTATFAKPKRWPGAVSISMDPEGETTTFYADDVAYAQSNTNAGYSGDYESALIPDEFRKEIMGEIEDANRVMLEKNDTAVEHFALLFEFSGDVEATRHVFYNCVATRPSVAGATKEETAEAQTETLSIKCGSIHINALDTNVVKGRCNADSSQYSSWYNDVYVSNGLAVLKA